MTSSEAHRLSLARDLHDSVLQEFLVIVMQLRRMERSAPAETADRIDFGLQAASRGIGSVRQILLELRSSPSMTTFATPAPALAEEMSLLLDAVLAHTPIERSFRCADVRCLQRLVQRELVSIVREAATNVVRHAGASRFDCRVVSDRGVLRIVLQDDGCGLGAAGHRDGFGMTGMRERAALIGATLRFSSRPGDGTTVHLSLPIGDGRRNAPASWERSSTGAPQAAIQ